MICPRSEDGCAAAIASNVLLPIGLHETVAEETLRAAEREDVRFLLDDGLELREIERTIVNQRAPGMVDERYAVEESGPALGDLAAAAEGWSEVAFTASGGVEHRTDPFGNAVRLGELLCGGIEAALVVVDHRRIRRVHEFS
jgi:hypothetical protein